TAPVAAGAWRFDLEGPAAASIVAATSCVVVFDTGGLAAGQVAPTRRANPGGDDVCDDSDAFALDIDPMTGGPAAPFTAAAVSGIAVSVDATSLPFTSCCLDVGLYDCVAGDLSGTGGTGVS